MIVLLLLAAVACGERTTESRVRRALPAHHDGGSGLPRRAGAAGSAGHPGTAGPGRLPGQVGRLGRDPPAGCRTSGPLCGATTAVVVRVVDGDTVVLRMGGRRERVRLIGVDAPETWLRHDCFGPEATRALLRLIPPGSAIRTAPDTAPRDRFGRLLLYLWTPQGGFVNEALVQEGFARTMTVPPDTSRASVLREAERTAQRTRAGLWRACE